MRRYRIMHARPDERMEREGKRWVLHLISTRTDYPRVSSTAGGPLVAEYDEEGRLVQDDGRAFWWHHSWHPTWQAAMDRACAEARRDAEL